MYRRSSILTSKTPDETKQTASNRYTVANSRFSVNRNDPGLLSNKPKMSLAPSGSAFGGGHSSNIKRAVKATPMTSSVIQKRTFTIKDTRKLDDKAFLATIIGQLLDYINSMNVNNPSKLTDAAFRNPSNRDFQLIFESLWGFFVPNFKFTTNEEVLKVFRSMGYPFTLHDSTMKTVTAPHSWKFVLGAFDWLRQLSIYAQNYKCDQLIFTQCREERYPYFQAAALNKEIFIANLHCYLMKANGNENFGPVFENFHKTIADFNSETGNLNDLRDENLLLSQECQALETKLLAPNNLQKELETLELDLKKLTDYEHDAEKYRLEKILPALSLAEAEIKAYDEEIEQLKLQINNYEKTITKMNMSP